MAAKNKKYPGVYSVKGKKGVSYGIDYTHPQTGSGSGGFAKESPVRPRLLRSEASR